ncbi:MAG: VOC family protein [Chloroflexi bacterium]|nr:VOC family protein [Chloroflexota bacterium]
MSGMRVGSIAWFDLTVDNTEEVRDFYKEVVGWDHSDVDMDGYADYNMTEPGTDTTAAGIVHRRGINADIPPQWMIYIMVADLDASVAAVERLGGKVVKRGKDMPYAIIQDPAGAVAGLMQMPEEGG